MRYEHIWRAISRKPLAIYEPKLAEILAFLEVKTSTGTNDVAAIEAATGARRAPATTTKNVQVIPVIGTIHQRANVMTQTSGGTTTESLAEQVRSAANDASVGSILFHIDSPGGEAAGIPELADLIAGVEKPTIAIGEGLVASAAYWIGSSVDELYATRGTEVGSIGVVLAHTDLSGMDEQAGVKVTYVTAGENKAFANPHNPLSESDRGILQDLVDRANDMFVSGVAKSRGVSKSVVNSTFGQGLVFGAADAQDRNMIDGVRTLEQAIGRAAQLARTASSTRRRAAAQMAIADSRHR